MTAADLSRNSGVSLWRQIEDMLAREITEGHIEPGARLATEFALAARFNVNRHTVRRALASLQERGLLRIEQGRGIFVREPVIDYSVSWRTRFSDILIQQNRIPAGRLVSSDQRVADAQIAAALDVPVGHPVVVLETVGTADGHPVLVSSHHFPVPPCAGIDRAFEAGGGSITRALEACGVTDYWRRSSRVSARLPGTRDARLLAQDRTRPILVAENINVDDRGRPIEFGLSRFSGDWVQLLFEPEGGVPSRRGDRAAPGASSDDARPLAARAADPE